MNIREEIRNILQEIFLEAAPSDHFKYRIYNRLTSSIYTKPAFNYSEIENQINLIKNTNFDPNDSFAIFIKRFPITYISKDPDTGIPSIGDEVWAVVRENTIKTIFFRNSHQKNIKVSNVNNIINIKTLYKQYTDSEKNIDGTIDFTIGDIQKKTVGSRNTIKLNLPIVELGGKDWYIDEPNEQIIFVNNTKKTKSFDDIDEEYLEKIINTVTY